MTERSGFASTAAGGLDYDLLPLRLFRKAKRLGVWNPDDIDFDRDVRDWEAMSADERDLILRLTALFAGGEESVTLDLLPLIAVIAGEGRVDEEIYLASFLWEEAKHVDFFASFLHFVAPDAGDLHRYHGPSYGGSSTRSSRPRWERSATTPRRRCRRARRRRTT